MITSIDNAHSWQDMQKRRDELAEICASSSLDNNSRQPLQRELSFLTAILSKHHEIEVLENQRSELLAQRSINTDTQFDELIAEELAGIDEHLWQSQEELEALLYPPNPMDDRAVFLEIRAGAGGQEAALFAGDLLRMYTMYAIKKNWRASIVSSSGTDLGGFREVVLHIQGKKVYGHLKQESGVHRVQRVPHTETAGRVHTSTATVAALPEAEEVEFSFSPNDLRIDVYRASGAGGQHVNTTDSAVRITHIPTGVVVACQDERSQHKNKAKALKLLQSRLVAAHQEKQDSLASQIRKDLVGTGMRSEKVRTYNYSQNRVTDHQVEVTLNKLDIVMEGDLDDIIEPLIKKDALERRKTQQFKN